MSDHFTETTTTSWGKRITNSFIGMLVGLLLFIGAFVVLWWNEGRSVDRIKTLAEGRGLVISIASDSIDDANEGKLVHLSGFTEGDEYLADETFGLLEIDALKLQRTVEMYQWHEETSTETKQNMGGSETTQTTYSYKKDWSESLIKSSGFKTPQGHENPTRMPYQSETTQSANIYTGEFILSQAFTSQINDFKPYPLSEDQYGAMEESLQEQWKIEGDYFVRGNLDTPAIGDTRISFSTIPPLDLSVIGKQHEGEIQPYKTKRGQIALLEAGTVSADDMFAAAEAENKLLTWILRLVGVIMMWVGLALVFGPISVLGSVVPFIGSLLGAGIGLIALVFALPLSLFTIALAWVFYRPILGGILLVSAAVLFFGGWRMAKDKLKARRSVL